MTRTTPPIRLLPAPESEPPYDDEGPPDGGDAPGHETASSCGVQGTLALSFSLPSGVPARPQAPAELRLVRSRPDGATSPDGPADDSPDTPPDPVCADPAVRPWAYKFVQAVVEVLAGARPATQLLQWTSPEVYDRVRRRAGVPGGWPPGAGTPGRPRVHSVRLCQPRRNVTEVSAVVRAGGRARAVALRLESAGRHWRCTALELG